MLNLKELDTPSLIKWAILAVLVAFSCYLVFPIKKQVHLGLDLAGGTRFTVAIDEDKLRADTEAELYATYNNGAGLDPDKATDTQKTEIAAKAAAQVEQTLRGADATTLDVLRGRIDALGTKEPVITSSGNHRFVVEIPGASPEERDAAKASIGQASYLKLRLVAKESDTWANLALTSGTPPRGYVKDTFKGQPCLVRTRDYAELVREDPSIPAQLARFGSKNRLYECVLDDLGGVGEKTGANAYGLIYVSRAPGATIEGNTVVDATAERDPMEGGNIITVSFEGSGREQLRKLSTEHVGERMAIVLDDIARSAPVFQEPIEGGSCRISGNFTWADAVALSGVFKAGSLNVPIKILEQRDVSPSLGAEAIQKGTLSAIIGVVVVFLFMLGYYLYCGVIADIALALNIILWPAGMVIAAGVLSAVYPSGAEGATSLTTLPTLTLPGIAGLVLSVGMAVDANVLIFERMREEFRLGKTVKSAITAGYDRAFLAILDSNLTTLITGVILFIFGSGPIRGFAITLCGGIIISMFTALVVTRLIFRLVADDTTKPYKMFQWVPETIDFDFLKWAKPFTIAAIVIIVASCGIFLFRAFNKPADVMSVDFTGGLSLTYEATDKATGENAVLSADEMRTAIDAINGISDPTVQNATKEGGKIQTLVKIPDIPTVTLGVEETIRGTLGHTCLNGYALALTKAEANAYTYTATLRENGAAVTADVLPARVRGALSGEGAPALADVKVTGVTAAEDGKSLTFTVSTTSTAATLDTKDALRIVIDNATPALNVDFVSADQVGSQIGNELKSAAVWSIIVSLICIILYVSYRFQFGFALGGVLALAHDALMTLGVYTLCGNQVSLTTIAALLTIVGYSINDTIVAFDRVREILERDPKIDFPTAVRRGLNQTLSRTVLTTLSTLMPVAALYFFGGAAMHDFAFALFVGMVAGTFSTLFIAPLVTVAWYRGRRPSMPSERAAERAKKLATP